MKYILAWNSRRLGGRDTERYFISYMNRVGDIHITSAPDICGAKAFSSRQNAKWMIEKIERCTADLGIIDIVQMTDKELFEARLKGK